MQILYKFHSPELNGKVSVGKKKFSSQKRIDSASTSEEMELLNRSYSNMSSNEYQETYQKTF
jgi:hypothetical protein